MASSPLSPRLAFCILLLGISPLTAQSDLPPSELEKLRQQFETFLERREKDRDSARREVVQKVQNASRNGGAAASAYADAHRATQFAGKIGQSGEFSEWQKKNSSWLSDADFRTATQLHLAYLLLSLERAASDRPEDFLAPSREYLQKLADFQKRIASGNPPSQVRDILQADIKKSLFTQAWQLQPFLEIKGSWATSSGQAEQILDKNIRPVLLDSNSPDLLQTWDWQIQFEADLLQRERLQHNREQFENIRRPTLLFQRAEARAQLGQPARAASEAITLLQNHPAHPDYASWVGKIRAWLEAASKVRPSENPAPEPSEETPEENPA